MRQFRRGYADAIAPAPVPKKSGAFRSTLKWLWRLTYLSTLGGIGYVCYIVYDDRHPDEQVESDPTKKTLVILGMSNMCRSIFLS